jgi:hypothetical protein
MTSGLAFRLCGAIGVITKPYVWGEYWPTTTEGVAVDPVGVEIIKPSAQ